MVHEIIELENGNIYNQLLNSFLSCTEAINLTIMCPLICVEK